MEWLSPAPSPTCKPKYECTARGGTCNTYCAEDQGEEELWGLCEGSTCTCCLSPGELTRLTPDLGVLRVAHLSHYFLSIFLSFSVGGECSTSPKCSALGGKCVKECGYGKVVADLCDGKGCLCCVPESESGEFCP